MSHLAKLKTAVSRKELAAILGYSPKALTAIIYQTPQPLKYTSFEIEKKSGGKRTIKAPIPKLKKLQSHLSHVLYQCLEEIEKERGARPLSFGFRRNRSIAENAARHKRRRWVLNIDIEDFFPSFNFGRVRGFFLKDKAFSLHSEVATTIAQIACDGVALPQGSPCSPVVSELIAQILDMQLVRLAKKHGVTYSRYADDITFSTSRKEFPVGLAFSDSSDSATWHLSKELIDKISQAGFKINSAKTRMQFRGSRQSVTGLIVNEKVNVKSEYYRRVRAMCNSLFESGSYFKEKIPAKIPDGEPVPDLTRNLNFLEGMLSHIYSVTQHEERRDAQEQRQKPRAIRKLYRRFLFYKYFLSLNSPLIVTEGKTDPIYLRGAVENLPKFHPILGKPGANGFEHAFRYFNYGGLVHEVLDLGGGGSGNLKSIPFDYQRNLYPYRKEPRAITHRPMRFPVILVIDSDDGVAPVAGAMKEKFKAQFTWKSTADFYHITDNLYVVKTPEDGSNYTCIEDLFPKTLLSVELNGKKFKKGNDVDITKEYGKEIFAKSVVKASAKPSDFTGFDPLLDRICGVINDYAKRIK